MSIHRLVRFAVVLVALAAGLQTLPPAYAARLGPLSVLSERGQPLRAEVEVEDTSGDALAAEPAIVTAETYRDLGLTFPASLRGASVTMARRDSDGRPVIRISGRGPTDGPELIVVMSLSTRDGRHLRSYRLDLDAPAAPAAGRGAPPAPSEAAPAVAEASTPGAVAVPMAPPPRDVPRVETPATAPAAVALPSSAPREAAPEPAAASVTRTPVPTPSIVARPAEAPRTESATVTVGPGDTAASIANRVRPADVTEAQAVTAIYRNNTAAFDGSVSRLRPGATLRIPDPDQMRALPAALAEQALRRPSASAPGSASASASTSASTSTSTSAGTAPARRGSAERRDRLQLSAGGTGRGRQADARGGAASRQIAFEAAMSESRSRISQLESIVEGLNRLIAERDRQLAELAGDLRVAGVAVAPAATPVGQMPVPSAAPDVPPVAAAPAPASDASPALGAAAATMLPAPTRRAPVPIPEPEPEPWYTDRMLLGAAGIVVLLLVLLAARLRGGGKSGRRRDRAAGRFAGARF